MNYNDENKEDKKYKKGYGRKEFKKDVQEAVEPVVAKKMKMPKLEKSAPKKKITKRSEYSKMSATQLRKFVNEKKRALLIKSGFPDGKVPRSKDELINLCMKLKRKRW